MNGCCSNNPGGIRYLYIDGQKTGILGLLDIFEAWISENKQPNDLSPVQILEAVRRHNYISTRIENIYVETVRSEYGKYLEEKNNGGKGTSTASS